jgi:hypothetical protein
MYHTVRGQFPDNPLYDIYHVVARIIFSTRCIHENLMAQKKARFQFSFYFTTAAAAARGGQVLQEAADLRTEAVRAL